MCWRKSWPICLFAALEHGGLETAFRLRDPYAGCWEPGGCTRGKIILKLFYFFFFFMKPLLWASVRSRIWNIKSYDLNQYSGFYRFTFLLAGTLNNEPKWGVCPTWYQAWGSNTGILALFCTLDWEYFSGCNSHQSKQEFCNWELT